MKTLRMTHLDAFVLTVHGDDPMSQWTQLMTNHRRKYDANGGAFLVFAEQWFQQRGYDAEVTLLPGQSLFNHCLAWLSLRIHRYGLAKAGMKVFDDTRPD